MKLRMKKRGFTMVELMIVIAIISVLATIIIPKMTGAKAKTGLEACKSNIRSISIAMEMYSAENNGCYTPTQTPDTYYVSTQGYPLGTYYSYLLSGYLKGVITCPGTGNTYCIDSHMGSAYNGVPINAIAIWCDSYPSRGGKYHIGCSECCPIFWIGGKIIEKY